MAKWLRCLTRKPKVRTAVGSNPALDSLVFVRNPSPGRPEPCEGNLVTSVAPAGNKSLRLSQASHVKYKYLPTYLRFHFFVDLESILTETWKIFWIKTAG